MLSGSWRHIIGAFCLTALACSGQAQEAQEKPDQSANEQQGSSDQLPIPLPILVVEPEQAAIARQNAEEATRIREQRDLLAQESMDAAAQRMAQIAFWQTVLVFVGTVALIWTLLETRAMTVATREIGDAQTRPYPMLKTGSTVLVTTLGQSLDIEFRFPVFNAGQTPVTDFSFVFEIFVWQAGKGAPTPNNLLRRSPVYEFATLSREDDKFQIRSIMTFRSQDVQEVGDRDGSESLSADVINLAVCCTLTGKYYSGKELPPFKVWLELPDKIYTWRNHPFAEQHTFDPPRRSL